MRISSSGNVGIGSTNPTNTLVVSDGDDGLEFRTNLTADNRILSYNRTTSAYTKMSLDAADYDIRVAGSVIATIDASGNFGINSDAPSFNAVTSDSPTLEIKGEVSTKTGNLRLRSSDNSVDAFVYADSTNGLYLQTSSNHPMRFATNSGERMRILSSGGITFNGDTAAANALDDYEEGTWTPSPNYGTLTFTDCQYTKIGRVVHVSGALINLSDYTTTEDILISGLPFTAASDCTALGATMYRDVSLSTMNDMSAYVASNGSVLRFYSSRNDGAGWAVLQYNDLDSGLGDIYFSITYHV